MKSFSPLILLLLSAATLTRAATTSLVVATGSQASGGSSTNIFYTGFGVPAVNASGQVSFQATVNEVFTQPFAIPLVAAASVASVPIQGSNTANPLPAPSIGTVIPVIPKFTNSWSGIWNTDSKGARNLVSRIGAPFMIVDAGGFGSLSDPILNSVGTVAWAGTYYAGFIMLPPILPGAPVTNFYSGAGIWTSSNSYNPVAFVGETAPGYPKTFTTSVGTLNDLLNQQSTNGFQLSNSPVNFTNWINFSSIDRVVLPDTGGVIFSATVGTSNYYYPVSINGISPNFVAAQPLTQHGIWAQRGSGSLSLIAREGEMLNIEGSNRTVETLSFLSCTNAAGGQTRSFNPKTGAIVYTARFTDGNVALIQESTANPGGAPMLIAATGDAVPGFSGNTHFTAFGDPALNSSNHVAFQAAASTVVSIGYGGPGPVIPPGSSIVPPSNSIQWGIQRSTNSFSGIWADDAQGNLKLVTNSMITYSSMHMVGGNGFTSFSDPVYNKSNAIAFTGTWYYDGTPVKNAFNGGTGVWTSQNLSKPVAWIGQPAPGYPNPLTATIASPYSWSTNSISYTSTSPVFSSFDRIALPDTGRLVLWATVSATNTIPLPTVPKGLTVNKTPKQATITHHGIWVQNASGGLDLVVREGAALNVNGKSRVITSLVTASADAPTGSQSRSFNQTTGALVYLATFTDGTQAILKVTP